MSQPERERYLQGADLDWDHPEKARILGNIARSGHKVEGMDPDLAFENVRLISVEAGEVLIEADSPPGFVYIPLAGGLKGIPLSGNRPFSVCAWMPLGNTSVIRGAVRNATVVVEQPLRLLMIPKEVYLKTWHATYTKAEFRQIVGQLYGQEAVWPASAQSGQTVRFPAWKPGSASCNTKPALRPISNLSSEFGIGR